MLVDLREFFTLWRSDRAAAAAGASASRAERLARLVVQRARAAETLLVHGHLAEASRLADESLALLRTLREQFASVAALVGPLPEEGRANDDLAATASAGQDAPVDEAIDEHALREKISTVTALARSVDGLARGRVGRSSLRWQRIGTIVCIALVAAIFAVRQARTIKLTARCSGSYDVAHGAQNAVDGYLASTWVLPDNTPGWLEVTFNRRVVRLLEVVNAQGLSNYGVRDATVELYQGARLLRSIEVSMAATIGTPNPTKVPLLLAQPIDRIRIQVKTWHGYGGGIAEVRVE